MQALELGPRTLRPAVPLSSCGMAGKLLDLSEPIFLICKSGLEALAGRISKCSSLQGRLFSPGMPRRLSDLSSY